MIIKNPAALGDAQAFEAALREACGCFKLLHMRSGKESQGLVSMAVWADLTFVEMSSNLQQLSRSRKEINLDQKDDLFLIFQEEGNALMSQHESSHWLQPGDAVLIDSAEPSEFTFFGEFNKLALVLLHRSAVVLKSSEGRTLGGNFLPKSDPLNGAIAALLQKMRLAADRNPPFITLLRDALFALLAILVGESPGRDLSYRGQANSGMAHALKASRQFIDSRYRDPNFNMREMADTLRLSMRQIQRAFTSIGTTPTKYLLIKRLEHVRKEVDQIIAGRRTGLISSIAFEAGFSDLSYFQRTFRRAFGNTPRDYLSGIAERLNAPCVDEHST